MSESRYTRHDPSCRCPSCEPIKPATDQEIKGWLDEMLPERPNGGMSWMDADEWAYRCIARIEADCATIANLRAQLDPCEDCGHARTLSDDGETLECVVC